jgi:NTP pyrophosphatase (non-canonical NTP hydrolase)
MCEQKNILTADRLDREFWRQRVEGCADDAMTDQQYIKDAIRTESDVSDGLVLTPQQARLLHVGLGLATEAGEFLDQLKKHFFYKTPLDLDNLDEELGDTFWYSAIYLHERCRTFLEIMDDNIRKLKARYPEKFDSSKALRRDIGREQEALKQRREC